jgi:hypothetical protein
MTTPNPSVVEDAARSGTTAERALPQQPASWMGVISLSVGVFALVTAEFLPASLPSRD